MDSVDGIAIFPFEIIKTAKILHSLWQHLNNEFTQTTVICKSFRWKMAVDQITHEILCRVLTR